MLDACRPGLPDLRLREAGAEVPFAFARESGGVARRYELSDVESAAGRETAAIVDRGPHPSPARAAELEITQDDFLKPVVLESSEDGTTYREFARGSLFSAAGIRSTTLRFPSNDRRFWRFRLDDRNGPPVRPLSVQIEAAGASAPPRQVPLTVVSAAAGPPQILAARLPAGNVGVSALRLRAADPAYERSVQIFERVFFRDEVFRRLVGAGTIRRVPEGAAESEIAVCELTSREIELQIDGPADSRALTVEGLTALANPPRLIFFAGPGMPRILLYGSASAARPRYDLARVLREGAPRRLQPATLGPATQVGEAPAAQPAPRGAPVDPAAWKSKRPIQTPPRGGVTYLDLAGPAAAEVASARIVDGESRPVPHLVEQTVRRSSVRVAPSVRSQGTRTTLDLTVPEGSRAPDAIVLRAAAPDYFSRDAVVVEDQRDERGVTGPRILGSAHWERRPGEPAAPLTISIAPPAGRAIRVEIENAENPPLSIGEVDLQVPYVRLDFLCAPGEKLWLLTGNPEATAPRYDLAMVADRVLSSPAAPSRLGEPEAAAPVRPLLPKWFWGAVAGAAVLVVLALARTLRGADPAP